MNYNMIGDKIKSLRNQNKLTQRELADMLSVSVSTISHWENGRRLPSITELQRLGVQFDVNLSAFELDQSMGIPLGVDHSSSARTQNINIRPIGDSFHTFFHLLFILSVTIQLSSLFLSNPLDLIILILGIVLSAIPVTVLFLNRAFGCSKQNLTIPINNRLFFEQTLKTHSINRYRKVLRYISLLTMPLAAVAYTLSTYLYRQHEYTKMSLFVAFFAIIVLVLYYYRGKTFDQGLIFNKKIDYYLAPFKRRHPFLCLTWLTDYGALVLIGLSFDLFVKPFETPVLALISMTLLAINAVVSFLIIALWQTYIRNFSLVAIDEKGNKYPLF